MLEFEVEKQIGTRGRKSNIIIVFNVEGFYIQNQF